MSAATSCARSYQQIIQPSAHFSDLTQIIGMARKDRGHLMCRAARINPVHPADAASFCFDRLENGTKGSWATGVPETRTWEQIGDLTFAALGRTSRISAIPKPVAQFLALRRSPRADALQFARWGRDLIGKPTGTHTLAEFFRREMQGGA